jgi:parvulin-like peptidyl-prolyl isomerase
MRHVRIVILSASLLALIAAGCGGGDDDNVPSNAIAVVDGREIPKADFDGLLKQAKRTYEAQKRDFPKAGTPEYNQLKNQAVEFLVQRAQFDQKAGELDVTVTDAQVSERLDKIKKQYFGGNDKRYQTQLKQQGLTDQQVRKDIRAQLVQEELFKRITDDVKVTDGDIKKYYDQNKSKYGRPESRQVRHILVSTKPQADRLYSRLTAGESFARLAKQFSKDPGSKDTGGKLTIARGQTVKEFDETAFKLDKGVLSKPVKTQYGYHLIEPLSAIIPAQTTPFKQVRESIKAQLLNTKRNETMTKWVEDTKKDFSDKTSYQVGYAPPKPATGTGTTQTG